MASVENVRDRSPDRRDRRDSSARRSGGGGAYRGGGGGKSASNSRRAPPERRIFVSNIPFEMKWQEVKDLFRDNVGDVSYVELFNDENEKPRGCGILEFATEDLAKNAVDKMHRYEYKGRKLVVKEDFETERDKYGRIINSKGARSGSDRDRDRGSDRRDMSGSMRSAPEGYGNTYGLSPQFLESLGIDGPLHTRLFIANLSYTVDERKLREVFRLAGRVVMVELNRDKDGKSRGHAVIEFDHPVEAVQAISMFNDQALYDRKLTVRFDKSPGPTPEELAQLPSRLPEGLGGVGMGLGSGGNPLTEVAKNLPQSNQNQSIQSGSTSGSTSGNSSMNVLELAKTIAVARQLDMMGSGMGQQSQLGNLGNLGAALGSMGSSQGMGGSMSGGPMGSNMSGMSGNMPPVQKQEPMGGSSMTGGSMSGGPMGSYMGPMGRGPMDDMGGPRGPMSDMGPSRGGPPSGPSGYSTSAQSSGPSGGYGSSGSSMSRGGPMDQQRRPFDTIVIRNLPMDCNWQVLRDGFSHCGDIKYAEMKERGTGLIRFAYEKDAERAITMMHNQKVNDRVIDVRPYY